MGIPPSRNNTRPNHVFKDTLARVMLDLWKHFECEYFTSLHYVREKKKAVCPVNEGDLVHVLDQSAVMGFYRIGRVKKKIKSADGIARRFIIESNQEEIERSYNQIAPFY